VIIQMVVMHPGAMARAPWRAIATTTLATTPLNTGARGSQARTAFAICATSEGTQCPHLSSIFHCSLWCVSLVFVPCMYFLGSYIVFFTAK
jgi:hypothetical protein